MDRQSKPTRSELKCMLCDENAEPKALPLSLLEEITDGFSQEQEIGRGGFAVVYKGMLDNGAAIAVKRLSHTYMYKKQFHREIECLIKVKHENVVRFIGYCVDSQGIAERYDGKFVLAEVQQRLLCFEYLPYGTLDKYITDATCGLDWRTRYKIINGICNGLQYLHQNRIVHLDLKPSNILLDGNMFPKITDFGLSRCFNEKQSRAITTTIGGTMGYLAPEFGSREITYRFDLYSLGVIIIEIVTGKKGYEAVENVLHSWSNRLKISHRDIQLQQVRVCTEIGIECIESNPAKRPASMQHIMARLHETGNIEDWIEAISTRSSALQAETDYDGLYRGAPKPPGGTSSEGEKRTETDKPEEPSHSGPMTPRTDKKLLARILDKIQINDTYGILSEPVDDEELPDYKHIIKYPMDFSTVRKNLDKGEYASLEKFEDDVFSIISNAMCYHPPGTVLYRQARRVLKAATKHFEDLRKYSDAIEPLPEPEQKMNPRRRTPRKNRFLPKIERPPAERATTDFSRALATAANGGLHAHFMNTSCRKDSFDNRSSEPDRSSESILESTEDYLGPGSKLSGEIGKNPVLAEQSRPTTYYQHQPSSSTHELPSSYNGTRKLLEPISIQSQQSSSSKLSPFAAQAIPPGIMVGRGGVVGDDESPNKFQSPVRTSLSAAITAATSTAAASSEEQTDSPAKASHSAGPHPRMNSQAEPSMQCGSLPQVSLDRGEQAAEIKISHNVQE